MSDMLPTKITTGKISGNDVCVKMGDITQSCVDAIVVPEFKGGASYGGVGGSVARSGAIAGMQAYDTLVDDMGPQSFGTVLLTDSGGGKASKLLHIVSVGSGKDEEFNTIKTGFFNALEVAARNKVNSIAVPALGTGIIGQLTGEQSAQAMMSALKDYSEDGGPQITIEFVIYGDHQSYTEFADVLTSGSYATANNKQAGRRRMDLSRWSEEMTRDGRANREYFGSPHGPKPKYE